MCRIALPVCRVPDYRMRPRHQRTCRRRRRPPPRVHPKIIISKCLKGRVTLKQIEGQNLEELEDYLPDVRIYKGKK